MTNFCTKNISLLEKKVNSIFQITHESLSTLARFTDFSGHEHNHVSTFETAQNRLQVT
jgi:hypothetical protein